MQLTEKCDWQGRMWIKPLWAKYFKIILYNFSLYDAVYDSYLLSVLASLSCIATSWPQISCKVAIQQAYFTAYCFNLCPAIIGREVLEGVWKIQNSSYLNSYKYHLTRATGTAPIWINANQCHPSVQFPEPWIPMHVHTRSFKWVICNARVCDAFV